MVLQVYNTKGKIASAWRDLNIKTTKLKTKTVGAKAFTKAGRAKIK